MRKKVLYAICVLVLCTVAVCNVTIAVDSGQWYDVSLVSIEAVSGEDDGAVDGGELPGYEIVCGTGGTGRCYTPFIQNVGSSFCSYSCAPSGSTNDYCSSFMMGLLEFCQYLW